MAAAGPFGGAWWQAHHDDQRIDTQLPHDRAVEAQHMEAAAYTKLLTADARAAEMDKYNASLEMDAQSAADMVLVVGSDAMLQSAPALLDAALNSGTGELKYEGPRALEPSCLRARRQCTLSSRDN